MAKWIVSVQWQCEVEADDEGAALIEADTNFSFMGEARADEIESEEADSD